MALAKNGGAVLKLGLALSIMLAAGGTGYYYAIYLPARDARLENERLAEKARADAAARAALARKLAEQQDSQQRRAVAEATAQIRYQACLKDAGATHEAAWAAACKDLAEEAQKNHADCLANGKLAQSYCDSSYGPRDASPHCALPPGLSSQFDADLAHAQSRCLQESKAAVQ